MASIIYISKYPPLEGGIASKTYWLTNALACSGHTIHVVTDAIGVDANLMIADADQPPEPPAVIIHRADQAIPWHIPNENHRGISLLDKAIEIASKEKADLIVGGYLVPYGIIAFQLSRITGIPFVLMHGGSDIQKFLLCDVWPRLLPLAIADARAVITDNDNKDHLRRCTQNITVIPPYVPDPGIFTVFSRKPQNKPTLALIGKANYHWQYKGWHEVLELWADMPEEFKFVIVSQGIGLDAFKSSVPDNLIKRITWVPFVPPWQMPELLKTIDGLFYFQGHLPFPMFSNTVLEALSCGTSVFVDSNAVAEGYRRHGIELGSGINQHLSLIKPGLSIFSFSKSAAAWDCSLDFERYISSILGAFKVK